MPKKQLTSTQIQELHNLVQRNAVKYYDIEVEIVDHYATAIEAIWEKEPDLPFYDAQMKVYRKFWDFKGLEEQKIKQVSSQAYKNLWKAIKAMFGWPKVVELLLIFSLCWLGLTYAKDNLLTKPAFGLLVIVMAVLCPIFFERKALISFDKVKGRHFLSLYRITTTYMFFPMLIIVTSDRLFELETLVPCALVLAIYFTGIKDMHYILKGERNKLKKHFA